jgi:hypothetical protein
MDKCGSMPFRQIKDCPNTAASNGVSTTPSPECLVIRPHVCIGHHLARSEMKIAPNPLLLAFTKGLTLRAPQGIARAIR